MHPMIPTDSRAALFVAHPGHELRVHHWLELARPLTFVLTDGSGWKASSRLHSTSRVLEKVGASRGEIYGRWTDAEAYAVLLRGDVAPLVDLTHELAAALVTRGIDYIAADAAEGFNPSHDLCRYIVDAALALLAKESGRHLDSYDFLLLGPPDFCPEDLRATSLRIDLDDAALERKLAAAENYPELKGEVAIAIEKFGKQLFRTEYLRRVSTMRPQCDGQPFYERHGEQQVAAGFYKEVIRFREGVQPLIARLWESLGLGSGN